MWNRNTRRRGKKEMEEIFEAIMTDNFPKFMSDTKPQIQEGQKTPSSISEKKRKNTQAQHIQTAENQTKIPERIWRGKKNQKPNLLGMKIRITS